jgi:hypothetical protein
MQRIMTKRSLIAITCALLPVIVTDVTFAKPAPSATVSSDAGKKLLSQYETEFTALRKAIESALPRIDAGLMSAYGRARDAANQAEAEASAAEKELGKIYGAKSLIDHAKKKWIAGAEKGIADANAAMKKATNDQERAAAKTSLAEWLKNKAEGEKALVERQAAYDSLVKAEPKLTAAAKRGKEAFTKAKAAEAAASKKLIDVTAKVISTTALDSKLLKSTIMAEATPAGLAMYAEQGETQKALIDKLFANSTLMMQMLEAGGAKFGKYGQAIEILTAIEKVMSDSKNPTLQRLALATSLEHAKPIEQSNPMDAKNAPKFVDPVKRYLQYEKAFLAGELDPAFKNFTTWELRMVVCCDAPDEIAVWGREMLRSYRPDQVTTGDYGWRYVNSVRTDVPYGSQNVSKDQPSLQQYQNIALNGGVCGRRAFYGRFVLRAFGIPTWGVTQKAHAALSHWTPKGWVINLGAGFANSWWDKDEAPRSGLDFLLESQARAHGKDYLSVLRARWISRTLGEQQYNQRKSVEGGFWSQLANNQSVALASTSVALGPLGKELAEANEANQKLQSSRVEEKDQKITMGSDGSLIIPAVAHSKPSGGSAAMASHGGGMQLHITAGYKSTYEFQVPKSGKYALTAKVATLQDFHNLSVATNATPAASMPIPYTIGLWENTAPLEVSLNQGRNTISLSLEKDSKGITIKEFYLKPIP